MANQAIALMARAPQVPNFGAAIQQNAMLINQIAQQRAAERQAAQAQQEMQYKSAKETRESRAADLDYKVNAAKYFRQLGQAVADDATYQGWLARVERVSPEDAAGFRAFSPTYDPAKMDRIIMEVEQYVNKNTATPMASFQVSKDGVPQAVTVGGFNPSVKEIPQFRYESDQPSAPPVTAAPQAPSAFDRAFGEGIPAGEDAIDAAAQAIVNGAGVSDPALKNLTPKEFDEANLRAGKLMLAKPISAERGAGVEPLTMDNAPQIVDAALKSGFIDPSHVEQLKQMVGPENGAAIDQWVQQSGLKMAGGMPGMRSAVYRPQQADFGALVADDGMPFGGSQAPMGQQIGYVPTTTRFKSPAEGPLPGSAQVPIPRVRAEAQAQRETPEEAAAKARATKQVEAEIARTAEEQKKLPGKQQVSKIVGKIRSAYEQLEKSEAIPSEKRNAFANLFDYAATSTPGREVQKMFGTSTSKYLTEITSSRKLLATAIKNATGMSAQEMNSNTELQLMLDALTDPTQGIEAARSILGTIEELYGAPKAAARPKTPPRRTAGGANVSDW